MIKSSGGREEAGSEITNDCVDAKLLVVCSGGSTHLILGKQFVQTGAVNALPA